ncbi:MAG: hypothetical protein ACRKFN_13340 [Desulfitobacterium sp.]
MTKCMVLWGTWESNVHIAGVFVLGRSVAKRTLSGRVFFVVSASAKQSTGLFRIRISYCQVSKQRDRHYGVNLL